MRLLRAMWEASLIIALGLGIVAAIFGLIELVDAYPLIAPIGFGVMIFLILIWLCYREQTK